MRGGNRSGSAPRRSGPTGRNLSWVLWALLAAGCAGPQASDTPSDGQLDQTAAQPHSLPASQLAESPPTQPPENTAQPGTGARQPTHVRSDVAARAPRAASPSSAGLAARPDRATGTGGVSRAGPKASRTQLTPKRGPTATGRTTTLSVTAARKRAVKAEVSAGQKERIDTGCGSKTTAAAAAPRSIDTVPDGPQPRWVCAQPTVSLDPLWRGRPLEFEFKIRNEGQADLTFNLRKG